MHPDVAMCRLLLLITTGLALAVSTSALEDGTLIIILWRMRTLLSSLGPYSPVKVMLAYGAVQCI